MAAPRGHHHGYAYHTQHLCQLLPKWGPKMNPVDGCCWWTCVLRNAGSVRKLVGGRQSDTGTRQDNMNNTDNIVGDIFKNISGRNLKWVARVRNFRNVDLFATWVIIIVCAPSDSKWQYKLCGEKAMLIFLASRQWFSWNVSLWVRWITQITSKVRFCFTLTLSDFSSSCHSDHRYDYVPCEWYS